FDDLYAMSADTVLLEADEIVDSADALMSEVGPQRMLLSRMFVDSVSEAPNGAHFTFAGGYGRDEAFQKHYAAAAKEDSAWEAFTQEFLSGSEEDYQRPSPPSPSGRPLRTPRREPSDDRHHSCRVLRRRVRRDLRRGRRALRLPPDPDGHGRRPPRADDHRARPADHRRRVPLPRADAAAGQDHRLRGLHPVPPRLRRAPGGHAPRGDGRQPDRQVRQPEHLGLRRRPAEAH